MKLTSLDEKVRGLEQSDDKQIEFNDLVRQKFIELDADYRRLFSRMYYAEEKIINLQKQIKDLEAQVNGLTNRYEDHLKPDEESWK